MGNNKSTVAGNFITLIFGRINVSVVIIVTTLENVYPNVHGCRIRKSTSIKRLWIKVNRVMS